jgi:RNA polymerase sigma-70 factor (ECF subfamily)
MRWESPSQVEALLREESAKLHALAARLVSEADADDCVQDATLAALTSPPTSNPAAWLRTVVRRLALRRWRDRTRRRRREAAVARPERVPSAREAAERMETRRRILAAVEDLGEPYRTTVVLRFFDGLGPTEIARAQGVPVKTVQTRLSRALARLRAALDESYGGRRAAWAPLASLVAGSVSSAGAAIAMKKTLVAASMLVLLGGVVWWATRGDAPRRDAVPGTESGLVRAAPVLQGTAGDPAREAPPTSPGRILEGEAVPQNTFAGRVIDESGRGVPAARVRAIWNGVRAGSGEAAHGTHLILLRERERHEDPGTTTDSEGYFRIDRRHGSSSYLRAEAGGWPAANSGPHDSGSFVVIRLDPGARLSVRVVSAEGDPLPDAEVRLVTSTSGGFAFAPRQVLEATRTDAAGAARLSLTTAPDAMLEVAPTEPEWGLVERPLEEAVREVEVTVPRVRVEERRVVDADTGRPVPGAWVDLLRTFDWLSVVQEPWRRRFVADAAGVVRFSWQEPYYGRFAGAEGYEVSDAWDSPIVLSRAARIEGTVVDPAGRPVEGVLLLLAIPGTGPLDPVYVGASPVAAWTGADGRFALDVSLRHAVHDEPPPDRGVRSVLALHPAHPAAIADDVPVVPGTTRTLSLRFPRPATLEITVVDGEDRPIAGQRLFVARRIPRGATWGADHGKPSAAQEGVDTVALQRGHEPTTDAEGHALVEGLPPGLHVVRAENTRVEVDVREGARQQVRVVKGLGMGISGRVVDASGDPVAGAQVGVGGPAAVMKTSDAEGRFRFDDLPPGDYHLGVLVRRPDGVLSARARARPGDEVTLRLPAGRARLLVRVEGPPPGTAEFSLTTESGGFVPPGTGFERLATSSVETAEFMPGTGVLVVRAAGYGWTAVRFEAPALETTEVHVRLEPAGSLVVKVPDWAIALEREERRGLLRVARIDGVVERALGGNARGAPQDLERLAYAIQRSRGSADEHLYEHEGGTFRVADLSPGAYQVSYGHYEEGGRWASRVAAAVTVVSGSEGRVDL